MMQCQNFRVSISGYHKQDVDQCLDKLDREMTALQTQFAQLEAVNATLVDEKTALENKVQDYDSRKDAFIKLELDAQLRADQMVAQTEAEIQEKQASADAQLAETMAIKEAELAEKLTAMDGELAAKEEEIAEQIDALNADLAIQEYAAQKSLEETLAQLDATKAQRLAEMEQSLSDAKLLQQQLSALAVQLETSLANFQDAPVEVPAPDDAPTDKTVAQMFEEIMEEES
ncbi:MAG: hypothetical protein R3Y62_01395 [Eubacteriales bacterium]